MQPAHEFHVATDHEAGDPVSALVEAATAVGRPACAAAEGIAAAELRVLRAELERARHEAATCRERAAVAEARLDELRRELAATRAAVAECRDGEPPAPEATLAERDGVPAGEAPPARTASRDGVPAGEAPPAPTASVRAPRPGFDDAAEPLATLGLDGRFRELNPPFCELVGYREAEFAKAVWPSVHDRRLFETQREELQRLAAGELDAVRVQSTYMHGEGMMVPVLGELRLVRDPEGRPAGLLLAAETHGLA
jgi:PAS domain S-box-containing protein